MVSSFSNPGFPPVHAHPTRLPAMNACVSAAFDSFEASMRAAFREALAPIRHELSLLRHDLALAAGEVSDPAPMISDDTASVDPGHNTLHRFGQPNGDCNPLRISSVTPIDSIPPLLCSSPLLRAMAISPVKAHLNDSLASTIPTSRQGFVFPLRNAGTTKTAIPFPLTDQHISDSINLGEYGVYRSFNSQIQCICMLPSTHMNTTKRRHEVLTSLLSNFTNWKDKWDWILQFILAYYIGAFVIMYEDFLTDKCGWVNWYLVGKFVKNNLFALHLFDELPKRWRENNMAITELLEARFSNEYFPSNPSNNHSIPQTYFEFIFSRKDHREINFGALAIDLLFSVFFTSNLDFRLVWDPEDASANAVKLMLYLQCKDGRRMGTKQSCFCSRQCGGEWHHAGMPSLVSWLVVRWVRTWEPPHESQYKLHNDLKTKFVEGANEQTELYNKVFELKGNMPVFSRCRPLNTEEVAARASMAIDFEDTRRTFKFDAVFGPQVEQADVFEDTASFATSVLDGYIVYGQTGSGKSFTIEGTEEARGVNFRTLQELFQVGAGLAEAYSVTCCAVAYFKASGAILCMLMQHIPHPGMTFIHHTILCNNERAVEVLISCGVDVEVPIQTTNSETECHVHMVLQLGLNKVLQRLISVRCNINSRTKSGETALMTCARYKHQECLKFLASDRADFGLENCAGQSASVIAELSRWALGFQQAVVDLLCSGEIVQSSDTSKFSLVMLVTQANDVETLKKPIVGAAVDLNEQDEKGYSAAMVAAEAGFLGIFKLLIDAGADINLQSKHCQMIMELFVTNQNSEEFEKLFLKNAAPQKVLDSTVEFYGTLHQAVQNDDTGFVLTLVSKGSVVIFRRKLPLKGFDVEQRAVVAVELKTCLFTSVALQVLMLHNWWSYASSLAPNVEPSTTLLLSTEEGLVQKLFPQAVLAQLISHLPSKNDKFTLRLQYSLIKFHCKQFQISIVNPNLEDKVVFQGKGNVMNLGFSDWLNHY